MEPLLKVLSWIGVFGLVAAGFQGAFAVHVPVSGLVIGPALLFALCREGRHLPRLIWGALTSRLPIESWPEAVEAVTSLRAGVVVASWACTLFGLVQVPWLATIDQVDAVIHASLPLVFGALMCGLLLDPLTRRLRETYQQWIEGLKEAMTPPEIHRAQVQEPRASSRPIRQIA